MLTLLPAVEIVAAVDDPISARPTGRFQLTTLPSACAHRDEGCHDENCLSAQWISNLLASHPHRAANNSTSAATVAFLPLVLPLHPVGPDACGTCLRALQRMPLPRLPLVISIPGPAAGWSWRIRKHAACVRLMLLPALANATVLTMESWPRDESVESCTKGQVQPHACGGSTMSDRRAYKEMLALEMRAGASSSEVHDSAICARVNKTNATLHNSCSAMRTCAPGLFAPSQRFRAVPYQVKMRRGRATAQPLIRSNLWAYVGSDRSPLRTRIRHICEQSSRCSTTRLFKSNEGVMIDRLNLYAQAVFCAMPAGTTASRAGTFQAISEGCVPIFFDTHLCTSNEVSYAPFLPATRRSKWGAGLWSVLLNSTEVMRDPFYLECAATARTRSLQLRIGIDRRSRPVVAGGHSPPLDPPLVARCS